MTPPSLGSRRPEARRRLATIGAAVLALAALVAFQLVRQQGARSWDTLWAEDGRIYLRAADHLSSLHRTYSGYLQLVCRLVAVGANFFPLRQASRYFAVASALVTALCAVFVYVVSDGLVRSKVLRSVLALSLVALPVLLGENLANAANLPWALLLAGFWAVLAVPRSTTRTWLAAGTGMLAALSSVLALLYLPLVALLAWKRRDRRSRTVLACFALGAAIQGVFVVTASDPSPREATNLADLLPIYSERVLGSALLGERDLGRTWNDIGYGVGIVAAVVVAVAIGVLVTHTRGAHRCLGAITVGYSVVLYLVPVAIRGTVHLELEAGAYGPTSTRFSAISILLLLSGFAIFLDGARLSATGRKVAVSIFVAQFVIVAVVGFRGTNGRSGGPAWPAAVAAAEVTCRGRPTPDRVQIPITPPGWSVELSCSRVTSSVTAFRSTVPRLRHGRSPHRASADPR